MEQMNTKVAAAKPTRAKPSGVKRVVRGICNGAGLMAASIAMGLGAGLCVHLALALLDSIR